MINLIVLAGLGGLGLWNLYMGATVVGILYLILGMLSMLFTALSNVIYMLRTQGGMLVALMDNDGILDRYKKGLDESKSQ